MCVYIIMRLSLVTGTLSDLQYVYVCVMRAYGRWEEEEEEEGVAPSKHAS